MRVKYLYILISIAFLLFVPFDNYAQNLLWSKNYGGSYNEGGNSCLQTADGGYVALGSTYSYGTGDFDIYLLKLDSVGDTLWTRTFGGSGTEYGYDIQAAVEGGFIIVGKTRSFGAGMMDVYLIRTDSLGRALWTKTYGGAQNDDGMSVRQTSDSGFIVCGTTNSFGAGYADVYLVRTDTHGDTLWTRTCGGAGGDLGYAVRTVPGGGFIVCGTTGSFGTGYSSMYVIRTDADGDTLWTTTYGGNGADMGYAVENTLDGGFVFAGATASFGMGYYDAYLVKTDADGWLDWDSTYGGSGDDRAYSVCPTGDGGFILAGTTESFGSGKVDIYLVKTDPTGEKLWQNTYGGSNADYCYKILEEPQKNYFLVGNSYSYTSGGSDIYVMKVDGGDPTPVIEFPRDLLPETFTLEQNYPNPFNAGTVIGFTLTRRTQVSLTVYDILGRPVREWAMGSLSPGDYSVNWNGTDDYGTEVATGIYLYRLETATSSQCRKMLLLK
jgi:hypothetical protein